MALFAAAGRSIGGFDLKDTLTYAFMTQGMIVSIGLWGQWEIAERIRTGDIVTDLFRPYDFQGWWLAQDLGRAAFAVLGRGVVPVLAGAIVFDLRMPESAVTVLAVTASFALAIVVGFGLRYLANLATFWTLDHRGPATVLLIVWNAASGFIVPLTFFPGAIRGVLEVLPFAATIQVPVEVFLEKRTGIAVWEALAFQTMWAAVLLLAGRALLAIATRRVVSQGG